IDVEVTDDVAIGPVDDAVERVLAGEIGRKGDLLGPGRDGGGEAEDESGAGTGEEKGSHFATVTFAVMSGWKTHSRSKLPALPMASGVDWPGLVAPGLTP